MKLKGTQAEPQGCAVNFIRAQLWWFRAEKIGQIKHLGEDQIENLLSEMRLPWRLLFKLLLPLCLIIRPIWEANAQACRHSPSWTARYGNTIWTNHMQMFSVDDDSMKFADGYFRQLFMVALLSEMKTLLLGSDHCHCDRRHVLVMSLKQKSLCFTQACIAVQYSPSPIKCLIFLCGVALASQTQHELTS